MKVVTFWPALAVALLVGNMIAQAIVLYVSLSRKIRLVMLPIYAGFFLLTDAAGIVLASLARVDKVAGAFWYSHSYWLYYWTVEIAGCVLLVLLAFEIVTERMPKWKAPLLIFWGLAVMFFLLASIYQVLPSSLTTEVISVPAFADVLAACALLISAVSPSPSKSKGLGVAAAGVVALVSLHLIASIIFVRGGISHRAVTGLGIQAASLAGMIVFIFAAHACPVRPHGDNVQR